MTVIVNPFDAGGFTLAEMSAAIQMLPNPYGRVGQLGLFAPEPISQRNVTIESIEGELRLLPATMDLDGRLDTEERQRGIYRARIFHADTKLQGRFDIPANFGIVTDVDFRKRVIAEGRSTSTPIADIMTLNPLTLAPRDQASEALLLMARRNIRHLPVVDNVDIVGVVSASDLLRTQSSSALYLVGDIFAGLGQGKAVNGKE